MLISAQNMFHSIVGPNSDFLEVMPEPDVVEDDDDAHAVVDLFQPLAVMYVCTHT